MRLRLQSLFLSQYIFSRRLTRNLKRFRLDFFHAAGILGHSDIRITRIALTTDATFRRAVENLDLKTDFSNELVESEKASVRLVVSC